MNDRVISPMMHGLMGTTSFAVTFGLVWLFVISTQNQLSLNFVIVMGSSIRGRRSQVQNLNGRRTSNIYPKFSDFL